MSLKDNKPSFSTKPAITLIYFTKSDLGRISKCVIGWILLLVRIKMKLQLWNCAGNLITWFFYNFYKQHTNFLQLDISNYRSSISPSPFNKTLTSLENTYLSLDLTLISSGLLGKLQFTQRIITELATHLSISSILPWISLFSWPKLSLLFQLEQ